MTMPLSRAEKSRLLWARAKRETKGWGDNSMRRKKALDKKEARMKSMGITRMR